MCNEWVQSLNFTIKNTKHWLFEVMYVSPKIQNYFNWLNWKKSIHFHFRWQTLSQRQLRVTKMYQNLNGKLHIRPFNIAVKSTCTWTHTVVHKVVIHTIFVGSTNQRILQSRFPFLICCKLKSKWISTIQSKKIQWKLWFSQRKCLLFVELGNEATIP